MTEPQIKEANKLINQRELFEKSLVKTKFVEKFTTCEDWYSGSANWEMKQRMVQAMRECVEVCEIILRNRATGCLKEIDAKLKEMGVEK